MSPQYQNPCSYPLHSYRLSSYPSYRYPSCNYPLPGTWRYGAFSVD
jgi:hypothetical protein